ncbi:MAG TPA: hypothetical protein VJ890_16730 [Vineibacter sp.]|nr:hypothetical protein [Vineibacter sp.]
MFDRLPDLVNSNAALVRRGRCLSTTFLVEVGEQAWLIHVREGHIAKVERGPFRMASWSFALRGGEAGWTKFWQPVPPPFYQDIFGLLRQGELRFEGDLLPLWANMLYVKGVLGALRGNRGAP